MPSLQCVLNHKLPPYFYTPLCMVFLAYIVRNPYKYRGNDTMSTLQAVSMIFLCFCAFLILFDSIFTIFYACTITNVHSAATISLDHANISYFCMRCSKKLQIDIITILWLIFVCNLHDSTYEHAIILLPHLDFVKFFINRLFNQDARIPTFYRKIQRIIQ